MFSFAYPAALLVLLPSVGLVIAAYLRKGRTKTITVNSLFFLRHLPQHIPRGTSKFIPPRRFFFDALLAIALCLALSGLYLKIHGSEEMIFLIDNSLSMTAAPGGQNSLLAQARDSAQSSLLLRGVGTKAAIWLSSPAPHSITNGFVAAGEAQHALDAVIPAFSKDAFEHAIAEVSTKSTRIFTLSERPSESPSSNVDPQNIHPLKFRNGEEKLANIAILGAGIIPQAQNSQTALIAATVEAFTSVAAEVSITLDFLKQGNWQKLSETTVMLSPQEKKDVFLRLNESDVSQPLRITLVAENQNLDTLPFDNKVWLNPTHRDFTLNIVSAFAAQELGLDTLSMLAVNRIDPALVNDSAAFLTQLKPGPILFHRSVPKELPDRDAIFVLPPPNNALFPGSKEIESAPLTSWIDEHPILSYLSFQAMQPRSIVPFQTTPAWAQELIRTAKGPIAFAGTRGAHRYVGLGFELLPFEGKRSISASILLLNMLKWLGQAPSSSGYSELRDAAAKKEYSAIERIDGYSAFPRNGGELKTQIEEPGLYRATSAGHSEILAVNYFDASESDTLNPEPYLPAPSLRQAAIAAEPHLALLRWLASAALLGIGIDLLLRAFRKQKKLPAL